MICPFVVFVDCDASSTKVRKKKPHTYRTKVVFSMVSASATCSVSIVASVTRFWVLENQHTHAPAKIAAPPETDLLSVAVLA